MGYRRLFLTGVIFIFSIHSTAFGEEYTLPYFLSKVSSVSDSITKEEKTELLNQIEKLITKAREVHQKLTRAIKTGELDVRYPEGTFWVSKLEEDRKSLEIAAQQLKHLEKKTSYLVAAIDLYKSLKDLSSNFNSYNNMPSFSAFVGDLAPELELWGDPVFYKLYLLPLALLKDNEKEPPPKNIKKPVSPIKGKKP